MEVVTTKNRTRDRRYGVDSLTARERVLAALVCRGWSNQRISGELGITVRTVKNRLTVVYDKVGVHSRAELIVAITRLVRSGT